MIEGILYAHQFQEIRLFGILTLMKKPTSITITPNIMPASLWHPLVHTMTSRAFLPISRAVLRR